jgi:K(+)-stimulated pyrophosphate-energized sodium pump
VTDFLSDYGVVVALICAAFGVLYGGLTTRWLMAQSPGNEQMRSISAAIQEGAAAYLNRQYTIIGGVAVVLAILIAIALDIETAIGFVIGGAFSAAAGYIGMNVSVRANARVAEAARGGVARRYSVSPATSAFCC